MIEEGALDDPKPSAIFGLHVFRIPQGDPLPAGRHHGKRGRFPHRRAWPPDPWRAALGGIDPVVVASQIVLGCKQSRAGRSMLRRTGDRHRGRDQRWRALQHYSDSVVMLGRFVPSTPPCVTTSRTRAPDGGIDRAKRRRNRAGRHRHHDRVTYNDPALTEKVLPTLREVAGASHVSLAR